MCVHRSFLDRLLLLAALSLAACRGQRQVSTNIADGAVIAPYAHPELYVPRLRALGLDRLIVPWTNTSTEVAAIASAAASSNVELILGLTPSRTFEDEWNTPDDPPTGLDRALDRALSAGSVLKGLHVDHAEPGMPDDHFATYLDATIAKIRARTELPISFAIRARTLTADQIMNAGFPAPPAGTTIQAIDSKPEAILWANAWAKALAGKVERIVLETQNSTRDDLSTLKSDASILASVIGKKSELWITVDTATSANPGGQGILRVRPPKSQDQITLEAANLKTAASAVFVSGAEIYAPDQFLSASPTPLTTPPGSIDGDLEARALDVDRRLRRCCVRDGQVITVDDHRFDRDYGDNMWQEDSCWLTGLYASAMSFRYASTGDTSALDEAREAWSALHTMANTTPLTGEIVRNFSRVLYGSEPMPPQPSDMTLKRWRRARDREIYWVGDISVDQLSGWFNGVAAYYDLAASAEEKVTIQNDVSAVLDLFLANDLHAIEFTGQRTTYGDLHEQPVLALAFFQIGHHITGQQKYRDEFVKLLDQDGFHFRAVDTIALYHSVRAYGSDHFYSSGLYPLVMYETDRSRRAQLELAFEVFSALKRRFGDAYADMVYGVFHPEADTWRRAASQIYDYRPELSANAGYLAAYSALDPGPFVAVEKRPAAELDFDYGPPGMKTLRGGLEHRFTGVGYLLAYWMGRYHGLLGAR
jgi:hypothetical protein